MSEVSPTGPPRRRLLWLVVALAFCAVAGLGLALILPPFTEEYGGGDPSNYVNNAARHDIGDEAAFTFYPDEWSGNDAFVESSADDAFTLGSGVMSPFVRVRDDGSINIPQRNLYSRVLGVAFAIEQWHLPFFLNYLFLAGTAVLMYLIVRQLTLSRASALVAGGLVLLLPSFLDAVRLTRTETFAALLVAAFAWLTVRDRGRTAWPGLLLVALVLTRQEFVLSLYAYLAWAALRRKPGGWTVAAATVLTGYLLQVGAAFRGSLFPTGRPLFGSLPELPVWVVLIGYGLLVLVARLDGNGLDKLSSWLRRLGSQPVVHRVAWLGIVLFSLVAELLRQRLAPKEPGFFVLKGQLFSTFGLLIDTLGWPLLIGAIVGLVWRGYKLAGRAPLILALVVAPHAFVLVRVGVSPPDLFTWTRRFHTVVYPVLLIGIGLLLAALLERARAVDDRRDHRRPVTQVLVTAGLVAAIGVGLLGPLDRLGEATPRATRGQLDGFHEAAERLDGDAVVILDDGLGGRKTQTPLRTYHGLWSFVVYDEEALAEVLPDVLDAGDRPVLVDEGVRTAFAPCGLESDGDPSVVPVAYANLYDELRLAPVRLADSTDPADLAACATADPEP